MSAGGSRRSFDTQTHLPDLEHYRSLHQAPCGCRASSRLVLVGLGHAAWVQAHDTGPLDLVACVAEVALGLERPVEVADDPGLHRLGVLRDLVVDFGAPARERRLSGVEVVDEALEVHADGVRSALQVELLVLHEHGDYVVRGVAHRLLHIVRVEIL